MKPLKICIYKSFICVVVDEIGRKKPRVLCLHLTPPARILTQNFNMSILW